MSVDAQTVMHLDGCHFYVWVVERYGRWLITFDERKGTNLALHRRHVEDGDAPCDRCDALSVGSAARHLEKIIEVPEGDGREQFFTVAAAVGEMDEGKAGVAA